MRNLKLPPIRATGNNRYFTTTSKYHADRDENTRLNKNKELFELDPRVKSSSHSDDEKSQSTEQLFSLLKENKQELSDNRFSADLSMQEAETVCGRASNLFNRNKSSLKDDKREEAESYIKLGAVGHSLPEQSTEEEKSIFDISRCQQRLIGAMYRAKTVQEVIPNPHATDDVVSKGEFLVKELNTLSHNIKTISDNNDKIREELNNRKVSLIEDQLTTFMDMPGDFSDYID